MTKSNTKLVLLCGMLLFMNCSFIFFIMKASTKSEYEIQFNRIVEPLYVLPDHFVSIGIDTSMLPHMTTAHWNKEKLNLLASHLSPAYLRIGGTLSDKLIFVDDNVNCSNIKCQPNDIVCMNTEEICNKKITNITMTPTQLKDIYKFTQRNNFKLLFTLNALLRNEAGQWDSQNTEQIIKFAKTNGYNVAWQLGNEPNSFTHVFNITVEPKQLAADFKDLRKLLNKHGYEDSLIIGPDTTRPQPNRPSCLQYMVEFLNNLTFPLSVRSWHQYYLNSRTATLDDFWNPNTFKLLNEQIELMRRETKQYSHIPMWLTETSSSYGGGAPSLSDSFAGTPLWIDKLGLSAKNNITTVVRQSLIGGNYSLVDKYLHPLPDWWATVLYKHLVGNKVLNISVRASEYQRFYAHCTKNESGVTLYGINLHHRRARFNLKGSAFLAKNLDIDIYLLNAPSMFRNSKTVTLNGQKLHFDKVLPTFKPVVQKFGSHISIPPFTIGFFVIKNTNILFCNQSS